MRGAGRGREAQQGDLGRGVEPQPEQHAERIHVPALADHPERRPEDARQQAPIVQVVLERLLVVLAARGHLAEHPVDVDQDEQVDQPDGEQEDRGHARADDPADRLKRGNVRDERRRRRDDQRQRDHDRGVAQGEEQTHAHRTLPVLHQLAGGIVDRGDVVRVHRVAQAERVGEERCGQQDRIRRRGDQHDCPRAHVERDQECVEADETPPKLGRGGPEPGCGREHGAPCEIGQRSKGSVARV